MMTISNLVMELTTDTIIVEVEFKEYEFYTLDLQNAIYEPALDSTKKLDTLAEKLLNAVVYGIDTKDNTIRVTTNKKYITKEEVEELWDLYEEEEEF